MVVEVKAVRRLLPEHQAQLLHYLRATAMEVRQGPREPVAEVVAGIQVDEKTDPPSGPLGGGEAAINGLT